jgi:hypothetical protein
MGVRDSLRMVDSFLKWSARHPDKAKSLDDFVHDGLIAAAKRCESCLSDKLGLKFDASDDEQEQEEPDAETYPEGFESTPVDLVEAGTDALSEPAPEEPIPHEEPDEEPVVEDGEGVSLESVERIEDEEIGEIDVEGPPRDFTTDFELVEPSPMDAESSETAEATDAESEEAEEIEETEDLESEPAEKPSFTWSDYETAVSPTDEDAEAGKTVPPEIEESEPDSLVAEPEDRKVWSPYDEPSLSEEELTRETAEEEEPVLEETEDEEPITEPPAPPPPPESDEDEEERKRRARRLFFGA